MVHLLTLPEPWNIGYSLELHNELLNNYLENMLIEEFVVKFEVIFQNFQRRAEKIQEKSQISALELRIDIGKLGIRNRRETFSPAVRYLI